MADEAKQTRTLTEDEAYAIVADRVTRETAALSTQVETLTREKGELQSKLDISEAAVATQQAARETAEKALTENTAKAEQERIVAARSDERTAKVREIASHLKADFFTPERTQRWAAMEDDAFGAYIAELADLSGTVPATTGAATATRETAMTGSAPAQVAATGNAARLFQLARKGA